MSSIVPGPKKKLEEDITAARAGEKPLDASALNPTAPQGDQLTGLDDWPPTLRAAVEAEHVRVTALATLRRRTADKAVPGLVQGLDRLLELTADAIHAARKTKGSPEVPLDDVAELLGIPSDEIAPPGRSERRAASRTVKQLRAQLKELETTPDHSRLTRLTTFAVRLGLAVDVVPDAAGALAPIALDRYANALPDYQRDWPFEQKLASWQEARRTLSP